MAKQESLLGKTENLSSDGLTSLKDETVKRLKLVYVLSKNSPPLYRRFDNDENDRCGRQRRLA